MGLARLTLRLLFFVPLSESELLVGIGGNGVVGGGPAQPICPADVDCGWLPLPWPLRDRAPRPARLARNAARRAEAERAPKLSP